MGERLSPIGFWSYARQDDEEKLSQLRVRLSRQLQQQYGRNPVKIFQDVAAIPPGAEWEAKILDALNTSTFFIPIITPNFLESEWCNKEFFVFREREKQLVKDHPELAGHRRIFPIYYIDIEGVKPHDPNLLVELKRLQWLNFCDLIYKDDGHEEVQNRLGALARSLRQLLHLEVGGGEADVAAKPPTAPPTPEPSPIAAPPEPIASKPTAPPPPVSSPAPATGAMTFNRNMGLAVVGAALAVVASIALLNRPQPKPKPPSPPVVETPAANPRLEAAKLMVGNWRDQKSAAGCDGPDVSHIALAQPGADGAPRLELKNNHKIGVLTTDGDWEMDGGLWRYRDGNLELRAVGAPAGGFDLLIKCPTKDAAP